MKNYIIFIFASIFIFCTSCRTEEKQNLDVNVSGNVAKQNSVSISDVKILITRGKSITYFPAIYKAFDSLTTDKNGNYSYIVKDDGYEYKVCCGVPQGYSSVSPNCKDVNKSIVNSHTVPNIINFTVTK
ncbi:hypothetical protein [Halpernia frigidisoli]|uniref:Carboxypeptidase regulatory-like domain-containing protein n=1 Tax=Halpernia frigidisoli TaxID=1125876 RepID=A0A1I3CRU0_9FLAO|nr:hypothetical protein [Halpernia frigidisoli]SFH76981.1 hypothetical protein SAMN05443292_0026 [Halpernia frigidisoli]